MAEREKVWYGTFFTYAMLCNAEFEFGLDFGALLENGIGIVYE